ncbi:NCS1 allantoate transporter [Saccharata proteae CBS 121410]|uniref:NCS1 allantoate transporter n=1 Tax=Saccharata proteae CBS 121410 TaxID=1314787 RepID=A0A9P4I033_9PEZI|nr:NCS1 allantoate transporter [Saccharata proteae CBS 121410]
MQLPKLRRPRLRVQQSKSLFAEGSARWTNVDLDPVPRHARKWGITSIICYWISDAFNAATWEFASSVIAVGMTWRESLGIVALAFFIISWVIALNGATGVIHHAPFPVLARASWGFWGSYIAIVSRVILAIFWFAIQTMNGAETIRVMLGAVWPSFLTLPNAIPATQGIATNTMVCFFLFWLLQIPFLCLHPNNLRWLFMAKSILVPVCFVAILIWAFVSTEGMDVWQQKETLRGSAYSWAFLSNLTSVIGNYATLSVNQADFSRYSRVSVRWQILYVPLLPLIFTFISFIGIAASAAGNSLYGSYLWDPMSLISHWPSRACRFFAAAAFCLAALGVNVSANSLSAANDLAALFPRHVDIRRGQLLCALLCWALVPWKILESAGSFLNFMNAYAIFLGPVAGIMVFDFWVVHRRRYDTRALYDPDGCYRYWGGVNWRAVVAFLVGVAPNLPGFVNSINGGVDVGVGVHPYQFGWLLGFVGTSAVYLVLSWVWKPRESMVERAVGPDEVYEGMGLYEERIEGVEAAVEGRDGQREEKKGFRSWADRVL